MNPFDFKVFLQDTGAGETYLHWMMTAWGWTLAVSGLSLLIALVVGGAVGILRTLPSKPAAMFGEAWTELFRNIPLIVQLFLWYHVFPRLIPPLASVPSFVLVVFGLGFFTSARISEQIKAGIMSLPRGQRYAGLAIGLTLPQTYRYVLLPTALRIVIPPLTSESMNIVKNSSVAFAVSISELIFFAQQASEETSRTLEIYLAVTVLYFVSAFAINRAAALLERRARVPGMAWGGKMSSLDYGFLDWAFIQSFILKGLAFSFQLTLIAMLGGIVIGTGIALMRLSGRPLLVWPATWYVNLLRSIPLLMVILWFFLLIPSAFYSFIAGQWGASHRSELSAMITFTVFEAAYYSEIMRAGIQSVARGQVYAAYAVGMTYRQSMQLIVLPQAFRNMLPVLLTQTIILFQDTSLVYAIGAYDLLKGFETAGKNLNRPVETYLLAAIVYFIISFTLSMLVRRLQKRIAIIR